MSSGRVLIAGGGIAALEGLLAIRDLTDGEAEVTLLAPEREFTYRPLLVMEPFSPELADRRDLPALVEDHGGSFAEGRLEAVDAGAGTAGTAAGEELAFDFALIALGARLRQPFSDVHTLWIESSPTPVETLLARAAEAGGLDLIVPGGVSWALPAYEFALMAERRARELELELGLRIVTPEQAPLIIFGPAASAEVATLLEARGITVSAGAWVAERPGGRLEIAGEHEPLSGYPVALPLMEGIEIDGLPRDEHGFLPVDERMRVPGCPGVFGAGDGTSFPVKQGGIATQQADVAAAQIAAEIGFAVDAAPFRPVLRGRLLTGTESVSMRTALGGGEGEGLVSSDYLWWPPHKVSGRYLAPLLASESVHLGLEPQTRSIDVDVELPHDAEAGAGYGPPGEG